MSSVKEKLVLADGEEIIMECNANRRQLGGLSAKGGKLVLTNKRLVFLTHALNIGAKYEEIYISNMQYCTKPASKLLPILNLLRITTKENKNYEFIIDGWEKDKWVEKISELLKNC